VAPEHGQGAPVEVVVDRDVHPVAALSRVVELYRGSAVIGTGGQGGLAGLRLGRSGWRRGNAAEVDPGAVVPGSGGSVDGDDERGPVRHAHDAAADAVEERLGQVTSSHPRTTANRDAQRNASRASGEPSMPTMSGFSDMVPGSRLGGAGR
jgi:hypothetical protein